MPLPHTRDADTLDTPFPTAPARGPSRRLSLVVYLLASLLAAGFVVQLFFVGMALFVDSLYWWPHHELGHAFVPASVLLLVLTLAGRQPRRMRRLAGAVLLLAFVQVALAAIRGAAGALHPVNAMLLFGAIMALVREARTTWRSGG